MTASDYYTPGGEPFFYRGDDTGCLCVHGLTGMAQEMRWLGEHLADQGHTVYGPRLAGHGTDLSHLPRMRWTDWYGSVLDGYTLLRQACQRVFVLGLSLGGVLSLHLGTRESPDGIVAMAAPLELDEPALPYARYLKWVRRYVSKDEDDQRLEERVRALQAERDEPVTGKSHYRKFPVASLAELYDLQQITIQRLPRLTAPLLLAYSDNDQTVPIRNLERIAAAVGTPQADLHQLHLTQSDHILPMDVEMEVVFAAAADFVARYAGDGGPG